MGMHALNHTYSSRAFLKHMILVAWQEISAFCPQMEPRAGHCVSVCDANLQRKMMDIEHMGSQNLPRHALN